MLTIIIQSSYILFYSITVFIVYSYYLKLMVKINSINIKCHYSCKYISVNKFQIRNLTRQYTNKVVKQYLDLIEVYTQVKNHYYFLSRNTAIIIIVTVCIFMFQASALRCIQRSIRNSSAFSRTWCQFMAAKLKGRLSIARRSEVRSQGTSPLADIDAPRVCRLL